MDKDIVIIDGMKWRIYKVNDVRHFQPLCAKHGNMRLRPVRPRVPNGYGGYKDGYESEAKELECAEGPHKISLARKYSKQKEYIGDKLDAMVFSKMSILNLDEEAIMVAEKELREENNPYWVKAKVTESKAGTRLIIWAGDRSKKSKAQLFVEPEIQRLSFDHNDDHPTAVFAKVEVTFADDVKAGIRKSSKKEKVN